MSDAIDRRKWPWNRSFLGKAVVVANRNKPPRIALPGGLTLTLLSPTPEKLTPLAQKWKQWLRQEGLARGQVVRAAATVPEGF